MLKVRIATAVVLLAVLLPILWFDYFPAFLSVAVCFFAAGAWENFKLFGLQRPISAAIFLTALFLGLWFATPSEQILFLYACSVAIWIIRLTPALSLGLPPLETNANRLLSGVYGIAILGCFVAIAELFQRSPIYLLSVFTIVWVADIGAYFAGKGLGRRKLAPSISPGKTWEGAVGGWIAVMSISAATAISPTMSNTFQSELLATYGWLGFACVMTAIVVASVVGDLFESQLKRRAQVKDSSRLLPGHGGVLDRIDALIPVMPIAALLASRF